MSDLKVAIVESAEAQKGDTLATWQGYSASDWCAASEDACGCPDCHPLIGTGKTEAEAIADYWEKWEAEQE